MNILMAVKDKVLAALEQARGERLSGGRLAEALGVSRAAVHKAISTLRADGLAIDGVPGEGYRLACDDDSLTAAGVGALLQTRCIGREIVVVPSITSTNTVMKEQYLDRTALCSRRRSRPAAAAVSGARLSPPPAPACTSPSCSTLRCR